MGPVRNRLSLLTLLIAAGMVTATAHEGLAAPPELSFEDQAVLVAGATSGGTVAIFGVSQGFNGFTAYHLRNDELLVDEDGDGAVRIELELPLSRLRSVWAAVDLASGELSVAAPKGSELLTAALPEGSVRAEGDELTSPVQRWAYALWVRPGETADAGSWGAILGDGGEDDLDGVEDRQIRASVTTFVPIAPDRGDRPPERMAGGDLMLVVDPETLKISTTRLAGE